MSKLYNRLNRFGYLSIWLVAAAGWLSAAPVSAGEDNVPEGLSSSDWSSIRGAYEANRHAAVPVDDGYQARNPGQQWNTRFDGRGFVTTPDSGGWSWGLELVGYGMAPVSNRSEGVAPVINACGQRVEYQWDHNLTEWFSNDQRGLEHGYTVHVRPQDHTGGTLVPHLQFTLAVRGDLRPQVSADGRNVSFVNEAGAAVVHYNGLKVSDATGADVPAWFEGAVFNPQSAICDPQFLHLVVDDTDAVYPLTIDPIAQQAYLKASNTAATDRFGASVAISGGTVVVGAPDQGVNSTGAAYVFVRSGGVWSQQAFLQAFADGAIVGPPD